MLDSKPVKDNVPDDQDIINFNKDLILSSNIMVIDQNGLSFDNCISIQVGIGDKKPFGELETGEWFIVDREMCIKTEPIYGYTNLIDGKAYFMNKYKKVTSYGKLYPE